MEGEREREIEREERREGKEDERGICTTTSVSVYIQTIP